jgi:hypothetical protein
VSGNEPGGIKPDERAAMMRSRRGVRESRHVLVPVAVLAVLWLGLPAASRAAPTPADPAPSSSAVADAVRNAMEVGHLRAVVVKVTRGDEKGAPVPAKL